MYQGLRPLHEMVQNPHIYQLSGQHLSTALDHPSYIQYGTMCAFLSHRINQTRNDPSSKVLSTRFYSYWGLAVGSLNEHMDNKDNHASPILMAGILTLLLTDVGFFDLALSA